MRVFRARARARDQPERKRRGGKGGGAMTASALRFSAGELGAENQNAEVNQDG